MRLPTFGTPRIISRSELFVKHVVLPRGCLEAVTDLLTATGAKVELRDERHLGRQLGIRFLGELTAATDALMAYDTGVLAATTAFGKTVVAAGMIARRNSIDYIRQPDYALSSAALWWYKSRTMGWRRRVF